MRKALITGITGQDGSYLSELLLNKGYEVHGVIRRSSLINTSRINHVYDQLNLHYGDLTDSTNIVRIIQKVQPDEIYNLAAQSHVKVSFELPEYTGDVDALGTLRVLEAVRLLGLEKNTRIYQASTSELYGLVQESPQKETTAFYPRSPYGVAKLYGFWIVKNYRESYGMHASSGILYNHECFDSNTPLIIKKNNFIDIVYIRSLTPERKNIQKENNVLTKEINNLQVWNGEKFVKINLVTRRKISTLDKENQEKINFNTRSGVVKVTPNHKLLLNNFDKITARDVPLNTELKHGEFPPTDCLTNLTIEESQLYGMLVGDGNISQNRIRFTNNDELIRDKFISLCRSVFGNITHKTHSHALGYGVTTQVDISGLSKNKVASIAEEIYEKKTKHKKVPQRILNSSIEVKESFFEGYYACDGLKKDRCTYKYKSLKSNSPILCQGLLLIVSQITGQKYNINVFEQNNKEYYQINLRNSNKINNKGSHFLKNDSELKKKSSLKNENKDCFVYDIETECGYLNAGVGKLVVGNSPRRGQTFVTKKITDAFYKISTNQQDCLYLGNLNAKRDWGHAKDFVEAMWLILQQYEPDDYIIATGEQHSVREFVEKSAAYFNMKIEWQGEELNEIGIDVNSGRTVVKVDARYFRPAEVESLLGDATKAREKLGWVPKTSFEQLVEDMCVNQLEQKNEQNKQNICDRTQGIGWLGNIKKFTKKWI